MAGIGSTGRDKKKNRLRFTHDDDVVLLREVAARNPFANGCTVWDEIRLAVLQLTHKEFSIKTIRQHIQLLLDQWVKKEDQTSKSSGVEEPYSEKDTLLQESHDLLEDAKLRKEAKGKQIAKKKHESEIGKEARYCAAVQFLKAEDSTSDYDYYNTEQDQMVMDHMEASTSIAEDHNNANKVNTMIMSDNETVLIPLQQEPRAGTSGEASGVHSVEIVPATTGKNPGVSTRRNKLNSSRTVLGPVRKRAKNTNYIRRSGLDYLKDKNEREMELEEKRLKIEERKVAVAEKQVALAEQKFLFESQQYAKIFERQQEVIDKLLNVVQKNYLC